MSLAFKRSLNTGVGHPNEPSTETDTQARLNIIVVFTSVDATLHALARAGTLAESLAASITLVVPQIVPYPLPLTAPPVLLDFQERRFMEIAELSPVDIRVELYLCRDQREALTKVVRPNSLVVLGGRKRWWPTAEARIARHLRRNGHNVILAEL